MNIDVGFVLKAYTAAFTQGLAAANNKLHDLKKTLKAGDVGGGLKQMLGAGAVIASLRAMMNNAQDVRKSLEEMGQPIPSNIASVARLADGFDSLKGVVMDVGTSVLATFTRVGDSIGDIINGIRKGFGADMIDPNVGEDIAKAAEKSIAASQASIRKIMARNSPEALQDQEKKLADSKHQHALDAMTDAQKLNALQAESLSLSQEIARLEANKSDPNRAHLNDKRQEMENLTALIEKTKKSAYGTDDKLYTDRFKAESDNQAAKKNLRDARLDPYLPTIEDLSRSVGRYMTADPRSKAADQARQALILEEKAGQAAWSGDNAKSLSFQDQADKLRAGLGGFIKSDDVNKGKDLRDSVDKTNTILDLINKAISTRSIAATK